MRKAALVLAVILTGSLSTQVVSAQEKSGGKKTFPVKVVADLSYFDGKEADPERNKVNLYIPEGVKQAPVLFFIHGGGWTQGSREKFEKLGKFFASQGILTVCPGYRLSPKVQHPAHIEDVARVFAWTKNNIEKYGGRKDRIFVSGHSAGGHLAALLATNDKYLKQQKLGLEDVRAVIPISGVFFINGTKKETTWGKDPEGWKDASPVLHVSKNCPPFLILYAEKDGKNFHEMGKDLAASLKKIGVAASSQEMKDRTHGTIVGNIPQESDATAQLMLEFIRKHQ